MCHGDTYISKPQQKKIFFTKKYFVAKKAKDYDTNWLRSAVSDFVLASPQKVEHLRQNYEASIGSQVMWEELWSNLRNPNFWGNSYFLGAAALFLQINICRPQGQEERPT